MRNIDKYKTAQERAEAFQEFLDYMCNKQRCSGCKLRPCGLPYERAFAWLDLEAEEEKPLPCQFCGHKVVHIKHELHSVACSFCGYKSGDEDTEAEAISAHNRVAKKCREGKE